MGDQRHWQNFDRFKLIVSAILILLFLCLVLQFLTPPDTTAPINLTPSTNTPTNTPTKTATHTTPPTYTPTSTPTSSSTWTPTPTYTPTPTSTPTTTPTYTPTPTNIFNACSSLPTKTWKEGDIVKVNNFDGLNLREGAGIGNPTVVPPNNKGTLLKIMGEYQCVRHTNGLYYRWWKVRVINNIDGTEGKEGWSAETFTSGEVFLALVYSAPTSTLTLTPTTTAGPTRTPTLLQP